MGQIEVTESQSDRVTGSQSHRVTESQSHRVTESQSHRVTESQSHRVTESQRKLRITISQCLRTKTQEGGGWATGRHGRLKGLHVRNIKNIFLILAIEKLNRIGSNFRSFNL